MAVRAKREYLTSFRRSIEQRIVQPEQVRLDAADLSTIETLVQELAQPDAERVVYAIDVLESLDKRNLVTPLLLYHESPKVRARALRCAGRVAQRDDPPLGAEHPAAGRRSRRRRARRRDRRARRDQQRGRRVAGAADARRRRSADPRHRGRGAGDQHAARTTSTSPKRRWSASSPTPRKARGSARRDVAVAIRQTSLPRFRRLLIPLLYDPAPDVADEAMASVRAAGTDDFVFVPTLIALLRHRRLKGSARTVLVGYGEPVVDALAHFLRDPEEDVWVRRHIPATLALIPGQKTVDVLTAALADRDGFLRYKAVSALERLRRSDDPLTFPRPPVEKLAIDEGRQYFNYLSLHYNVFGQNRLPAGSTLALALEQKIARIKDRIYRLLTLIYPWRDIAAAQWTLAHGDTRSRASASEYLDNILEGELRKRIMPVLEEMPAEEKVRRGNVLLKTRPRDVEETLLQLINDEDQVVAAAAIDTARAHKIWALADDIEHVLAHRDARDWYVFEAASWALAENRMPAERRRELWHEPLPAAELATRLRELPLFASVSIDELFRIASTARQVAPRPRQRAARGRRGPRDHPLPARRPRHRLEPRRRAALDRGARRPRVHRSALRDADARNAAHRRPRGDAGDAQKRAADAARRQRRPRQRPVRDAVGDAAGRDRDRGRRRWGPTFGNWPGAASRRSKRSWRCSACRCSHGSRRTKCATSQTSPQAVDLTPGAAPVRRIGGTGVVADAVGRAGAGLERSERSAANRPVRRRDRRARSDVRASHWGWPGR